MRRPVPSFVVGVALLAAGCASTSAPRAPGVLPDGSLAACPPRPNCVSSLEGDVDGFAVNGSVAATRARLERAIRADGGTLVQASPEHLRATWRSRLFGFVDDVELVLAPDGTRFDVRSASRIGWSDLGANRRRVERLHARLAADASR